MPELLRPLIEAFVLRPVTAPLSFVTICALIFLMLRSMWVSTHIGMKNVKRLHQIPCPNCRFFTDDFRLKCTIHPTYALTEEAINCYDFCAKNTTARNRKLNFPVYQRAESS
ncbi:hypothetical protein NIES2101_29405 [Calothrix sp. HK-06]|nr:hypothetical protein NIES2101_29405 [Calothrix sp. HK-06]